MSVNYGRRLNQGHSAASTSSIMAGGHGMYKILGRNIGSQYVLSTILLGNSIDV